MKNFSIGKIVSVFIAVLMIFSMSAAFATVHGQVLIPTYSFINVAPNPCGVGQDVTVDFWLAVPVPGNVVAQNMTVYVTPPGGAQTSLGTFASDLTGGTYTRYSPATTGNYTFQLVYGGQTLASGTYKNDVESPSNSSIYTLVVQQAPAGGIPTTPLPTSWWQTPVNSNNVQTWSSISAPWLGLAANAFGATGQYNATGNDNPYTMGPTSGHILWTAPWCIGGVTGGASPTEQAGSYWTTSQYEPKWNPVVIDGIEYSTWYTTDTSYSNGIKATNLYNGQTMWVLNTTNALIAGYMPNFESPNQYGICGPYILTSGTLPPADTGGSKIPDSGTQFNLYDALTGKYVASIVNGTSPTFWADDENGNLCGYYVNSTYSHAGNATADSIIPHTEGGAALPREYLTAPALCEFNLTMAIGETDLSSLPEWTLRENAIFAFDTGIVYETMIPTYNGVQLSLVGGGTNIGYIGSDVIVLTNGFGTPEVGATAGWAVEAGFNQVNGQELWIFNRTETPFTRISENFQGLAADGVYIVCNENTFVTTGYSITTGKQMWQITLTGPDGTVPNSYDEYGIQDVVNPTTGIIYFWGLGGDIWAVNMQNGNVTWQTSTTILQGSPGTETPYGVWPIWVQYGGTMAGGNNILYLSEGHEYSPPLFHGAQMLALNGTTGALIWKELAFDDTAAENSYNIMTAYNSYDGQIYAFGQGPSKTTVTSADPVTTVGSPVIIEGTVTDVSAGASQQAVASNFPNGLPCVSDASMSQFMEAVYEQQPMQTNTTGVPISVYVLDSNNNYRLIGTTTSTANGAWGLKWTPDISGNYTVTAIFGGTDAYYGSSATTYLYAGNAPTAAPATATPAVGLATNATVEYGIVAIIIVIAIIGAVLALLVTRKHA